MNISTMLNNETLDANIPDDYEVLTRLLQYAMVEAERHGEAYCAALISRAVDALNDKASDLRNAQIPHSGTPTHLS